MLYGAAQRVAFGLGYRRLVDLHARPRNRARVLRAAGWKIVAQRPT